MMLAEYRVDTGLFAGPVELLLYLVKRQEIDICDISMSRIANEFATWFDQASVPDFEVLGDFAVVGSALL
ncbi:MAG: chromosome segregation protein ScpA, partial [Planctomycetaceae bacterium]